MKTMVGGAEGEVSGAALGVKAGDGRYVGGEDQLRIPDATDQAEDMDHLLDEMLADSTDGGLRKVIHFLSDGARRPGGKKRSVREGAAPRGGELAHPAVPERVRCARFFTSFTLAVG